MTILEILSYEIPIRQCLNNKRVWVSKICPICDYESTTSNVFRYHIKLKVGKCYHCGFSFKEKYWLEKKLKDKLCTVSDRKTFSRRNGFVKAMLSLEKVLIKNQNNSDPFLATKCCIVLEVHNTTLN